MGVSLSLMNLPATSDAGNVFEDIASHAIVLEGDRNRVETRSASDAVRDLGSSNQVSGQGGAPSQR